MRPDAAIESRSSANNASLLERLRADDLLDTTKPSDVLSERISSIKSNLIRLMNTRKGGADSAPGFGLGDFNDASVGSADMMNIVARDIRDIIHRYEPRIMDVHVSFDREQKTGLLLMFKVSGKTKIQHTNEQVTIDIVLQNGRNFYSR